MPHRPLLADSVTRLGPEHAGAVVITGSHGGLIAAGYLAAAQVRAAVANDAVSELGLAPGAAAIAMIKASHVVVGVPA